MANPLIVADEIYSKLPGLVIIAGFMRTGRPDFEAIASYLGSSWSKLMESVREHGHKNHPLISQWRDALRKAGVPLKKCPPSIEAMAKRTIKSESPFSVNSIVDTYNAISMDFVLPFGAYDVAQLDGPLTLRLCKHPESFCPMGGGAKEQTTEGEIVYSDSADILTRHFLWRQSDKGKITGETKQCVFVCEALDSMGDEIILEAKSMIEEQFKALLNATLTGVMVLK